MNTRGKWVVPPRPQISEEEISLSTTLLGYQPFLEGSSFPINSEIETSKFLEEAGKEIVHSKVVATTVIRRIDTRSGKLLVFFLAVAVK
jgi:hypothetical protein